MVGRQPPFLPFIDGDSLVVRGHRVSSPGRGTGPSSAPPLPPGEVTISLSLTIFAYETETTQAVTRLEKNACGGCRARPAMEKSHNTSQQILCTAPSP